MYGTGKVCVGTVRFDTISLPLRRYILVTEVGACLLFEAGVRKALPHCAGRRSHVSICNAHDSRCSVNANVISF